MRTLLILSALAFLYSCSKDNEAAKKLGGSWTLNQFAWAGKDSLPAGQFIDSLGTWEFAACKSKTETCRGTATDFFGSGTEGFGWYIRSKGTKFTFGADEIASKIAQFGGEWDISELTDNSFVITSESCGSCKVLGKETLTFTK